ncbi:MAG: hypothetical protein FWD57_09690 [Polyangiaceae bacterium]|nr:hypothetical protein [Polyangiaceae bacterium]
MKLFGYLDVDDKKHSVGSGNRPGAAPVPTIGESDEPIFLESDDPAQGDDESATSDANYASTTYDDQPRAQKPEEKPETRRERPSLSLGDMLFHPMNGWLLEVFIVGLVLVAVGALVLVSNQQDDLKFYRMTPVVECVLLWILARRNLTYVRRLMPDLKQIPHSSLLFYIRSWAIGAGLLFGIALTNLQAISTVIGSIGAILSILSLREIILRTNVLANGEPITRPVLTTRNEANLVDFPGVLTKIQWTFELGGVAYAGSCRVPYSEELAAHIDFGSAMVLYLPSNPKRSVAYDAISDNGILQWIKNSVMMRPMFLLSITAIATILVHNAMQSPLDKQDAERLREIKALLAIEDDCEFDTHWPPESSPYKDEYTLEFDDIARARRMTCRRQQEIQDVLAETDDCSFAERWNSLDADEETTKHMSIASIRIAKCKAATGEAAEVGEGNPPEVEHQLSGENVPNLQPRRLINKMIDSNFLPNGKTQCNERCRARVVTGDRSKRRSACYAKCEYVYGT